MRLVEVVRCAQDRAGRAGDRARRRQEARQAADRLRRHRRLHRQPHLFGLSPRGGVPARGRRAAARDRRGDGSATASPWVRSPSSTSPAWRSPGRGASARPRRAILRRAMSTSPTGSARPGASARRPAAAGTPIRTASATVDPDVTAMIEAARAAKGHRAARPIPNDEIVSRLLSAMADEGQALLAEGIAERAERHRSGDDQRLRLSGAQGRADVPGGDC